MRRLTTVLDAKDASRNRERVFNIRDKKAVNFIDIIYHVFRQNLSDGVTEISSDVSTTLTN